MSVSQHTAASGQLPPATDEGYINVRLKRTMWIASQALSWEEAVLLLQASVPSLTLLIPDLEE
jgi:hypothetical protein